MLCASDIGAKSAPTDRDDRDRRRPDRDAGQLPVTAEAVPTFASLLLLVPPIVQQCCLLSVDGELT